MSRPWMPLYISDYLGDTSHLSTTEHGAYLLLMMHYWQRGKLPDDDDRLARIAGSMRIEDWRAIRPTIQALFHDGWRHKRIDAEVEKARERSKAGRLGGRPKAKEKQTESKPQSKTEAPQPQLQPQKKDGGGGSAREAFDHFNLTIEIGKIAGYADASFWPPGWLQAPQRVGQMLAHGWLPETMLAAARETMAKKRDGPPSSITYFERPFARAHALQAAPLPVILPIEPQTVKVTHAATRDTGIKGALARLGERAERLAEGAVSPSCQDAPRLVSNGRG